MLTLQALLVSTGTVALAEIGDKTQLLALLLAARFRKPWPIAFGILAATLINHAISAWLGAELSQWLSPEVLRWAVAGRAPRRYAATRSSADPDSSAVRASMSARIVCTIDQRYRSISVVTLPGSPRSS